MQKETFNPLVGAVCKLAAATAIIFTLSRIFGLETSPPGFFSDEAGAAFNMLCPDSNGYKLLYPIANADGHYSAPFIYIGSFWMKIFGGSIWSYRLIGAFFNVLTILMIFVLMRRLVDARVAIWSALAAAASPWGFQFARFVTDNSLGPFFLLAGILFLTPSVGKYEDSFGNLFRSFVSAFCLAVSMYLYPPLRLIVPLVITAFLLLLPITNKKKFWLPFSIAMVFLLSPLLYLSIFGDAQRRFNALAIWHPGQPVLPAIETFIGNLAAHFRVSYLFQSGDPNLRHSSQAVGLLGPLDVIGLAGMAFFRPKPVRLIIFLLIALLISLLPGALTNHAIPHSLRTFSGWIFVSMLAGMGLSKITQLYRFAAPLLLAVSIIFFSYFSYCYYGKYPRISGEIIHGFEVEIKDAAAKAHTEAEWLAFAVKYAGYRPDAVRYYLISFGGMNCSQSEIVIKTAESIGFSKQR